MEKVKVISTTNKNSFESQLEDFYLAKYGQIVNNGGTLFSTETIETKSGVLITSYHMVITYTEIK